MGLVREPLEVDFVVNPQPLSALDQKAISDFIKADKAKRKRSKDRKAASSLSTGASNVAQRHG